MLNNLMNWRSDTWTARKVDMGLLTRAVFSLEAAVRYALLAGRRHDFILEVLSRPADRVRQYYANILDGGDHRAKARF